MLWSTILTNWEKGITFKYPKNVKGKFLWNTSVLKNDGNVAFKQKFRTHYQLPEIENKKDFLEHIKNSQNEYVISFPNLSERAAQTLMNQTGSVKLWDTKKFAYEEEARWSPVGKIISVCKVPVKHT